MKTTRYTFFLLIMLAVPMYLAAQQTVFYQSVSQNVQKAKELFDTRNYISALHFFDQIASVAENHSDLLAEAMYYKALCGLKLDNANAEEELADFLHQFPESSFRNQALFEQAVYQFDHKKYQAALKTAGMLNKTELNREDLAHAIYLKGYSNFELKKMDTALSEFAQIKEGNSIYAGPAQYYTGHIHYLNERYEEALQELNRLKTNPVFEKVIPFYISQIYYKQGKYREVTDYTVTFINKVPAGQQPELARILGDSYFHLREFKEAIQYLEFFLQDKKNLGREENYMLGYCYYLNSEEAKAIPKLMIATNGKDLLAQNAYYHLAHCYVVTNEKNLARQAFEAASEFDFDPKIKEDALFNYAKITYELSYSPFNETIRAFDKYVAAYPDSENNDVAYDYLVKVYMSTNNFRDAMSSIEKIKVKSAQVKEAYQRVSYYRAMECFNNLDYTGAIENFQKSVDAGNFNRNYLALSLFWKAEAFYRLSNFNKSITEYANFLKAPGAFSLPEFKTAHYNLGYAYFQIKDYGNASANFRKYLNLEAGLRTEKVADANNRLGDCDFMNKNYASAIQNYDKALLINLYDADYALYQKAFCLGLQRDQQAKISTLQTLIQNYPQSPYLDDVLYEQGRTYERMNQTQLAIGSYKQLTEKFPQSSLIIKALVQLGLAYYNLNDYQSSINYYKKVVDRSPNSLETQAAFSGMKNSYIELNNIDEYFAYTQRLGPGVQVSVNEQDSLSYRAAEKLYMARDKRARAQFERYLNQFPNGSFALHSHFYLAELQYPEGEFDEALANYEYVLAQYDNSFTENALMKAAGLQYNLANYEKALSYFERYAKMSNAGLNLLNARVGIMRCQFKLGNFQACAEVATSILDSGKLPELVKRETNYKLALSLYKLNQKDKAFALLKQLSADVQSAEGAEAKFLVADILYEKQKLKEAEAEIMDFIDKNSPHQYWLAKSFILLSDIYLKNGDEFQAKHTLQSIQENYPEANDGIMDTTRRKIEVIEANAKVPENQSKPLEINLGGAKK